MISNDEAKLIINAIDALHKEWGDTAKSFTDALIRRYYITDCYDVRLDLSDMVLSLEFYQTGKEDPAFSHDFDIDNISADGVVEMIQKTVTEQLANLVAYHAQREEDTAKVAERVRQSRYALYQELKAEFGDQ